MTLLDVSNPDNKFVMASPELRGLIVNHGLRMIENGVCHGNDNVVLMLIQELAKEKKSIVDSIGK
jgi:hypothetical protein